MIKRIFLCKNKHHIVVHFFLAFFLHVYGELFQNTPYIISCYSHHLFPPHPPSPIHSKSCIEASFSFLLFPTLLWSSHTQTRPIFKGRRPKEAPYPKAETPLKSWPAMVGHALIPCTVGRRCVNMAFLLWDHKVLRKGDETSEQTKRRCDAYWSAD